MKSIDKSSGETFDLDKDADYHPVHKPQWYAWSAVEVIDAIEAWNLGYHLGNVVKYVARAGKKGELPEDKIRDLQKAGWYLDREIERLEEKWKIRDKEIPGQPGGEDDRPSAATKTIIY
ncbi:MAG: DUF3310 domain-containing protein [Planctomycetota bacterium]|nr:DUF3310 domain-containing protein [Planctomycetota bacterium]